MREGDLVGLEVQRWLLPTQHRIVVPEAKAAVCAHLRDRKCRVESVRVVVVLGPAMERSVATLKLLNQLHPSFSFLRRCPP